MNPFQPGDHIRVSCGGFYHHGIYYGGTGHVIHMTGLQRGKQAASVRWGRIERFGNRGLGAIEVVKYGSCDPPHVVLARATSLLGRAGYNVVHNNCEQVARWCKTGEWRSEQVDRATAVGLGVGGGAGAAAIGVAAVTAAGTSAPAIMSGLAGAGSIVGGGAAAGVAVAAAGPAAVATAAVRSGYRDDPALPQWERIARRNARTAGTVGAVGGALGTVAAISAAGVPGLSAVGITTGLVGIGGSMLGGLAVLLGAPIAVAGACAWLAHRASMK